MIKKENKYSIYKSGLNIGDLVSYKHFLFGKKSSYGKDMTSIVLEKKHLFDQETRWGIRGFYEYEMLNVGINTKRTFNKVKTQNLKVKKVILIK